MAGALVNRKKLGNAVDIKLSNNLDKINAITKIPKSKLLDIALELLSEKYKSELDEYNKLHPNEE